MLPSAACLATCCKLVSCSADFRPWRWRWKIPPKRRFTYGLHGAGLPMGMKHFSSGSNKSDEVCDPFTVFTRSLTRLILHEIVCKELFTQNLCPLRGGLFNITYLQQNWKIKHRVYRASPPKQNPSTSHTSSQFPYHPLPQFCNLAFQVEFSKRLARLPPNFWS
jgi:hypothetical protein